MILIPPIMLLVAWAGSAPHQRSGFCNYEPTSLAVALERADTNDQTPGTVMVVRPLPRHRVTVVYTGDFRSRRRWHFELLAAYSMVANIGRIFDRYLNEVRVTEAGRDYWMPLNEDLRKSLRSRGTKADTIVAFVDLAGAIVDPDRSDWLFVLRSYIPRDSLAAWLQQECGQGGTPDNDAPPNPRMELAGAAK